MVALSLPVFFARTPEDFLEFTRARKPDPETGQPDMERIGAWLAAHPEAGPAIQAAVTAPPPASYATCAYNGIHAFRWVNAAGEGRYVRFRWEPEAGAASLAPRRRRSAATTTCRTRSCERLAEGPAAFRLVRHRWPSRGTRWTTRPRRGPTDRERVVVGRLELTGPEEERERDGDVLVFDPTRVVDGIELSDDPILHFRRARLRRLGRAPQRRDAAGLTRTRSLSASVRARPRARALPSRPGCSSRPPAPRPSGSRTIARRARAGACRCRP